MASAPFVLFYSLGYNWGKNFSLLKTGGVYVYAPENGVGVYVDGALDNTTSIFQHGILVKDLRPKEYQIKVSKVGYLEWKKSVHVTEEHVAEAYPFLIPQQPTATSVPQQVHKTDSATSTLILNQEFKTLSLLFTATSSKTVKTVTLTKATTSPSVESKKVIIQKDGNVLHALWNGTNEDTPFYFCLSETSECAKDFLVYTAPDIGTFNFYPNRNDVIIVAAGSKLLVVELDRRAPQNIVELYNSPTGENVDFRILDNDTIIVKEGKKITKLSLVYAAQ